MLLVGGVLAVSSACAELATPRPPVEEIADALNTDGDYTDAYATCLAQALHDSQVRSQDLQDLIDGADSESASPDSAAAHHTMREVLRQAHIDCSETP